MSVFMKRTLYGSPIHRAVWFMTPLGRFAVAVGGRIARTVWRRLPEKDKKVIKDTIHKRRHVLYGAGLLGVAGGAAYYYSHIERVPLTNRSRYMMYNREDVRHLLKKSNDQDHIYEFVDPNDILPVDHPDYKLVKGIVNNILISNNWCKDLVEIESWRVIVAKGDNVTNAISLPTGDIIMFTGMIRNCQNTDELGFIIGHEIAHVVLNHGTETLSRTGLVSFLGLFVIAVIWFVIPSDLLSFLTHQLFNGTAKIMFEYPYSQQIELEADRVGLMFASKACYNPDTSINVWKHMPDLCEGVEYLSTHPCNEKRLGMLNSLLPMAKELYEESECSTTTKTFQSFVKSVKKFIY